MFRFFNLVTLVVLPDYSYRSSECLWHFIRTYGDIFYYYLHVPLFIVLRFFDRKKIQRKILEQKCFFSHKEMHKMKFPTSNSSLTVGSNNLQVSSDFNSSTSASGSQNREVNPTKLVLVYTLDDIIYFIFSEFNI